MKSRELSALEGALGYRFRRPELLQEAVTHSSHAREQEAQGTSDGARSEVRDNEQLEFLGDAVLGFVTSETLLERYPEFHEGQLSKTRAYLVSESHLVRAAQELQLGEFLRLGHGEEKSGGRSKPALLVDSLEAVLAALYLDGGMEAARQFILRHILEPELKRLAAGGLGDFPVTDYKSALQEAAHLRGRRQPAYVLVHERGPEHKKTFTVEARLHTEGEAKAEYTARGEGMTKKQAEQRAAKQALEYLRSLPAEQDGA